MTEAPFVRDTGLAVSSLLASSATLVCCVLPAVLVTLGAGATLAGLVTAFPQLIWLSEHKPLVFSIAAILVGISGLALWTSRSAPCPADPVLARACTRWRRLSLLIFAMALGCFALGALFAFVIPAI